jgi:hypothetical protein
MLAGEPGVWPVDRLTDEDQRMLWPDEIWPQEIGVLAVLDGGLAGPGGRVRVEAVREVIAARLRLVPRFFRVPEGRRKPCLSQTSDTRSPD